jgi:flagellar biosynthesis GTPase FlhF
MSATQQTDRTDDDPSGTTAQRFRAPTVEEALQRARELLGDDAEIIEANRIRRGGIGGFFATELGVEVLAQSPTQRAFDAFAPTVPRRGDEYDIRPNHGSARTSAVEPDAAAEPTPATDLAGSPIRGRAAWRAATGASGRPLGEEQLAAPLLAALIEQASTEEQRSGRTGDRPPRVFRPWRATDAPPAETPAIAEAERVAADLVGDAPTEQSASPAIDTDPVTSEGTGSFAEHFLRELMSDAEVLRQKPGRNRALPTARPEALPGLADQDGETAPRAAASKAAPRRGQAAASRQASKRRRVAEPELPLTPAAAPVATPAAETIEIGAPPTGDARTAAFTAIVDQCVQLASADRSTAPTKVAVSMTMADGAVVKMTVELPRSR